jgi:hypothetical protein
VFQRPDGAGDVGEGGRLAGAGAEVGVQGVLDLRAIIDQQPASRAFIEASSWIGAAAAAGAFAI